MKYSELNTAVYNWVDNNTDLLTIFADQKAPRPDSKYITIKIFAINMIGHRQFSDPNDNGEWTINYNEDFSVSIQSYGEGTQDDLQLLKDSLQLQSNIDDFESIGIAVRNESDITDISTLIDNTIEKRFLFEVRMGFTRTLEEFVGVIEDVDITPAYNQPC